MWRKAWLLLCLLGFLWPVQNIAARVEIPPDIANEIPAEHIVQPGDTLFSIAQHYNLDASSLARLNDLADPRHIYAGQRLNVSRPALPNTSQWIEHTVQLGEDWGRLSSRAALDWQTLARANGALNPATLTLGHSVLLPQNSVTHLALAPEGETLLSLALRQDIPYWQLAALNPLPLYANGDLVLPGPGANPDLPLPVLALGLSPQPTTRGKTVVLMLETAVPAGCDVIFLGKSIPCYIQDPTHLYALVGLSPMLEPGDYEIMLRVQTTNGEITFELPLQVTAGQFHYERIDLPADRQNLLDPALIQHEQNRLNQVAEIRSPVRYWQFPLEYPVQASISSYFGSRRSYGGGYTSYHAGVDFRAGTGVPIRAPASGTVVLAEELLVRGNAVMIDHGWGLITGYWHLSRIDVAVGDRIVQDQVIGLVGNTGRSTGSHLHWEIWLDGVPVDPLQWVSPFHPFPDPVLPSHPGAQ